MKHIVKPGDIIECDDPRRVIDMTVQGMTLRDWFASQALPAVLASVDTFPDETWRVGVAMDAYAMADAMLAARQAKGGQG